MFLFACDYLRLVNIHQKSPDYLFSGEPGSGQAEVSDCSVRGEQQDHGHQYLGSGEDNDDEILQ